MLSSENDKTKTKTKTTLEFHEFCKYVECI